MKSLILKNIEHEGHILKFTEKIRPKIEKWLFIKIVSPIQCLEIYLKYLDKMHIEIQYAKIKNKELKVKVKKELLGSKNPFDIAKTKHVYKRG